MPCTLTIGGQRMEKGGGRYERRMPSMRIRGIFGHPSGGAADGIAARVQALYMLSRNCYIASMRLHARRLAAGALVYVAVSALWFYGIVNPGRFETAGDIRAWSFIGLLLALHVAFGWAVREWAALVLPIVVVFLAIPAGYPQSDFGEPLPLWISQIFYAVVEVPAIVAGVALRTAWDGWCRTPWSSR